MYPRYCPLHPFMAHGVLQCGGYITSREAERAEKTPPAFTSPAYTNACTTMMGIIITIIIIRSRREKSIQKN